MNDTTLAAAERIRAFADAVRAQLADLPAEEIDDLVEGLVGDLTDQAADHDGAIDLGDPAAYAAELRSAAGLPERRAVASTKTPWHERVAAAAGRTAGRIRSTAFGAWLLDLLIALRPVWWVLRGFALATIVIGLVTGLGALSYFGRVGSGRQVLAWSVLVAVMLLSIQWGRGRWMPKNALRHAVTALSLIAIIALPYQLSTLPDALASAAGRESAADTAPPGLVLDGNRVANLFVYDKDGALIDGAQIYTNRGTAVGLLGSQGEDLDSAATLFGPENGGMTTVPFRDGQGHPVWNVYPLQLARIDDRTGQLDPSTTLTPQPPFLRAPDRALTVTPQPTPGSSVAPTASPSPRPSDAVPSPTPTPTPAG